jgi:ADP-heptose:LPS heptosyltransferase
MRIGLLNLTRFGDLVQTSPLLAGLRKRHPEAEIHLIVKSRFREIAALLPGVDRVWEIDGDALARALADPACSFMDGYRAVRRIADELGALELDVAYNLTHSRGSAVLMSLLQARERVGYAIDREGLRLVSNPWLGHLATLVRARRLSRFNLVDIYLGAAGLAGSGERLGVRVPAAARAAAAERVAEGDGPLLAVQLGASSDAKTWGVAHCAAALQALAARLPGLRCALVGVAEERARADELRARCPALPVVDLIGQTSIAELAAVLERCRLLLTGDTGTMHLAAAVGARTCAVFVGLGNPWETAAYGEGHLALSSRLACAPCQHDVRCGFPLCHSDFPPEWLGELLARALRDQPLQGLPALERADLYRTRFDEHGLLDLEPLARRRPDAHELLALAYRALFVESFLGAPARAESIWSRARERHGIEPREWSAGLPADLPEQLGELAELGREALARTRDLLAYGGDARALRGGAQRLAPLDARIAELGTAQPLLAPLALALQSALENLPESGLAELIAASARHYQTLERRALLLGALLRATPGAPQGETQ